MATTTHHPITSESQSHLLSPSSLALPDPSLHSSRPASIITTSSIDTIIQHPHQQSSSSSSAHHQQRTPTKEHPQSNPGYKGFASQEAYLSALRDWVETKMYFEPTSTRQLTGFYGSKTMGDYAGSSAIKEKGHRNQKGKAVVVDDEEEEEDEEIRNGPRAEGRQTKTGNDTEAETERRGRTPKRKGEVGGKRRSLGQILGRKI